MATESVPEPPSSGGTSAPGEVHDLPWGATPLAPLGSAVAFHAVGDVAGPLLAGFSIALIGVVAQAPQMLRWPGLALLAFTIAAGLLVFAIQASFFARRSYWTRDDLRAWYDQPMNADLERAFQGIHRDDLARWRTWQRRGRRAFNLGLIMLGLGVAAVLAPPATYGQQSVPVADAATRWFACAVALLLVALELAWWWNNNKED